MVFAVLGLTKADANGGAAEVAKNLFNATLPVLASWVGIVLAFYFSAASQDRTNETLNKMIDKSPSGPGSGVAVSTKMIPYANIAELYDLAKTPPAKITLADLQTSFAKTLPNGGKVERLIFVEGGIFKYVMHSSVLNSFIVSHPVDPAALATTYFAAMLADEQIAKQISTLVAFVAADATLGVAKAAMEARGASDIIVTGTGDRGAPMLGWLGDGDRTTALTAP
jgi:hypothetical protein